MLVLSKKNLNTTNLYNVRHSEVSQTQLSSPLDGRVDKIFQWVSRKWEQELVKDQD